MSSNVIIAILIIGFLFWVINRRNSDNKGLGVRNSIADVYLLLVADSAARRNLLEEIEETIEDFIKIDGRSRLDAERYTLADLMRVAVICCKSPDLTGLLAYDQLRLCIAECFPQHLRYIDAYRGRLIRQ